MSHVRVLNESCCWGRGGFLSGAFPNRMLPWPLALLGRASLKREGKQQCNQCCLRSVLGSQAPRSCVCAAPLVAESFKLHRLQLGAGWIVALGGLGLGMGTRGVTRKMFQVGLALFIRRHRAVEQPTRPVHSLISRRNNSANLYKPYQYITTTQTVTPATNPTPRERLSSVFPSPTPPASPSDLSHPT